jgi:hypothetical protein
MKVFKVFWPIRLVNDMNGGQVDGGGDGAQCHRIDLFVVKETGLSWKGYLSFSICNVFGSGNVFGMYGSLL